MNENNQLINDKKKQMAIFYSLMTVQLYGNAEKNVEQSIKELKEAEAQGQLRIYYPER